MNVREQTELLEHKYMSEYACFADNAKQRLHDEDECDFRTCFQRDRDRILHCNAFQRLKHKTQVFLSPESDHYRTRLTHTLEVAQIARTITRALRLNEDLSEAIALGHDLGHSPFGHSGEAILNEICPHGFKHYLQSIRVVDYIEKKGKGLNLTEVVKDGIKCHTNAIATTKEGNIVRLSDKIAYINHDIDDSIRAEILTEDDIPQDIIDILGKTKSQRISTLVANVVENGIESISLSGEIKQAHDNLRSFLFERVYLNPLAKDEEQKAKALIEKLYEYYLKNIDELPDEYKHLIDRFDAHRAVCDYISGMSDIFAVHLYSELFVPKSWKIRR